MSLDIYDIQKLPDDELDQLISKRMGFYRCFTCDQNAIEIAVKKLESPLQMEFVHNLRRLIGHSDFMEYEAVLAKAIQRARALLLTLEENSLNF